MAFCYDFINTVTAGFQPSNIHTKDTALFYYYAKYLLQKTFSVFEWTLPETWEYNYFLYVLYGQGYISILKTDRFGVIPQQCTLTGYNVFYQPSDALIVNPLFTKNYRLKIGEECAVLRLQPDYSSVMDIVSRYADLLALMHESAIANLFNTRSSFVFGASSKAAAETYKKMMDSITSGNPAVFIDKKLYDDNGKPQWMNFNQDLKTSYIITDLLEDMRRVEQMFLTEVGIPTCNTDKKERLLVDEIASNNVETETKIALWLQTLQKDVDTAKQIFPEINLSVDWRYPPETEVNIPDEN